MVDRRWVNFDPTPVDPRSVGELPPHPEPLLDHTAGNQSEAARIASEDVQLYYQTAILGRRDLALAPDPRTGFRMTLIRMLAFRPEVARPEFVRPTNMRAAASVPSTGTPETSAPAAAGTPEWSTMIGALDLDGPTRMLALNCTLSAREPGLIRLTLDARNAAARTRGREEKLAQALGKYLGESLRVEIAVGEVVVETPAQAGERSNSETLAAARAALAADPTVQALQQRFGASVNSDSVRPRKPA